MATHDLAVSDTTLKQDKALQTIQLGLNVHPQNQLHKAAIAYDDIHNYYKQQMIRYGLLPLANHHSEQSKRCRSLDDTIPWAKQGSLSLCGTNVKSVLVLRLLWPPPAPFLQTNAVVSLAIVHIVLTALHVGLDDELLHSGLYYFRCTAREVPLLTITYESGEKAFSPVSSYDSLLT